MYILVYSLLIKFSKFDHNFFLFLGMQYTLEEDILIYKNNHTLMSSPPQCSTTVLDHRMTFVAGLVQYQPSDASEVTSADDDRNGQAYPSNPRQKYPSSLTTVISAVTSLPLLHLSTLLATTVLHLANPIILSTHSRPHSITMRFWVLFLFISGELSASISSHFPSPNLESYSCSL